MTSAASAHINNSTTNIKASGTSAVEVGAAGEYCAGDHESDSQQCLRRCLLC